MHLLTSYSRDAKSSISTTDFSVHFALKSLIAGLVMNLINGFCLAAGILKGVEVLVVDNDRDSRDLYAFLPKTRVQM